MLLNLANLTNPIINYSILKNLKSDNWPDFEFCGHVLGVMTNSHSLRYTEHYTVDDMYIIKTISNILNCNVYI